VIKKECSIGGSNLRKANIDQFRLKTGLLSSWNILKICPLKLSTNVWIRRVFINAGYEIRWIDFNPQNVLISASICLQIMKILFHVGDKKSIINWISNVLS
jgi:hypothetical protein